MLARSLQCQLNIGLMSDVCLACPTDWITNLNFVWFRMVWTCMWCTCWFELSLLCCLKWMAFLLCCSKFCQLKNMYEMKTLGFVLAFYSKLILFKVVNVRDNVPRQWASHIPYAIKAFAMFYPANFTMLTIAFINVHYVQRLSTLFTIENILHLVTKYIMKNVHVCAISWKC